MGVILEAPPAADWFGFFSALILVALGGLIAAIVAYIMAQRASGEMIERDRTERRDRQTADTFRGMLKLLRIVNDIGSLHVYFDEQFAKVPLGPDSWQRVSPSIGLAQEPVLFEAADLMVFFAAKEHDFFMELLLISDRHKSLQEGYRTYVERRLELTDQLSANMIGHVAIAHFNEEQLRRFQPRMVELNTGPDP